MSLSRCGGRCRIVSLIVAACGLAAPRFAEAESPRTQTIAVSIPDVEWDAVFSRTEGWSGGDAAGSIDLRDGRTVWVFGDSWIGNVAEGKHAAGSHMVNNAIGVHPGSPLGAGRAPKYREIGFFWGADDEHRKPTAWVVPTEHADTQWFWANGGGVVVPGPDESRRLVVFLFHLTKRGDGDGVWNFKHIGSGMAIVDNVDEPADQWNVRPVLLPDGPGAGDATDDARAINWGVSAFIQRDAPGAENGDLLYIYGVDDTNPYNKRLMLARVAPGKIEQLDQWEYFAGEGRWSPQVNHAVPLLDNVSSELSVDPYVEDGRRTLLLVYSEPAFGRRILVRSAAAPEGPWADPVPVYTVPGLDRGASYFTYAAKGHLHLSRPGELLVTYIINSQSFWDMAADAEIYRPRFVRVPLQMVLPNSDAPR